MQQFKPNEKIIFPAGVKVSEVMIQVRKINKRKPVRLAVGIMGCFEPVIGTTTERTTTERGNFQSSAD